MWTPQTSQMEYGHSQGTAKTILKTGAAWIPCPSTELVEKVQFQCFQNYLSNYAQFLFLPKEVCVTVQLLYTNETSEEEIGVIWPRHTLWFSWVEDLGSDQLRKGENWHQVFHISGEVFNCRDAGWNCIFTSVLSLSSNFCCFAISVFKYSCLKRNILFSVHRILSIDKKQFLICSNK